MVSEGGSRPLESPKYSSPYSRHGCCGQSAAAHLGLPQSERLAQWVMKSQEIRRTAVPVLERPNVDDKSQRSQPADSIFRSEEYTFASSHLLRHCRRNFFGIRGCSGFERSGTENGNRAAVILQGNGGVRGERSPEDELMKHQPSLGREALVEAI